MWWMCVASAAVVFADVPTVGQPVEISLTTEDGSPRPGVPVRVVHRPGLGGEHELAVGITDAAGLTTWTPAEAGLVRVQGGGERAEAVVAGAPSLEGPALLTGLVVLVAWRSWAERRRR